MVLSTEQLIQQIESLPVEGRAKVIDSLLQSMNQPDSDTDALWVVQARRRLDELRTGRVKGVPAEEVFEKARQRFDK